MLSTTRLKLLMDQNYELLYTMKVTLQKERVRIKSVLSSPCLLTHAHCVVEITQPNGADIKVNGKNDHF